MGPFKHALPGDAVTLEMRIQNETRHMLQHMFLSSEEMKVLLERALGAAIQTTDIGALMESHAKEAINKAVTQYFAWGDGSKIIKEAVDAALNSIIPGLFKGKP